GDAMASAAGTSMSLLPSLPMLLVHLLAAVATGWVLRRGDLSLLRLTELSAHGVAERALVRGLRAALALVRALLAGLPGAPEAAPRPPRTALLAPPVPHTTALQHTVIRRGPPVAGTTYALAVSRVTTRFHTSATADGPRASPGQRLPVRPGPSPGRRTRGARSAVRDGRPRAAHTRVRSVHACAAPGRPPRGAARARHAYPSPSAKPNEAECFCHEGFPTHHRRRRRRCRRSRPGRPRGRARQRAARGRGREGRLRGRQLQGAQRA